jgi:CBS domain-containing protein
LRSFLATLAEPLYRIFGSLILGAGLEGMISFLDIKKIFALEGLGSLALAYDLMMNRVPATVPDVSLYEAMERMREENLRRRGDSLLTD